LISFGKCVDEISGIIESCGGVGVGVGGIGGDERFIQSEPIKNDDGVRVSPFISSVNIPLKSSPSSTIARLVASPVESRR
jgi:hypothetical protein